MDKKQYTIFYFSLLIFLLSNSLSSDAQIIYVQEGATGTGTSWSDATGDLKTVLDGATFGTEIWVAEGIYYPTTCTNCVFEDRQVTFQIVENIKLYGGFAGDETSIDERDIDSHPTILSGNIDQDDTPWGNSYSIIRTQNVTNQTVVDGFIIEDGTADFSNAAAGDPYNSGAGWYNTGALSNYFAHPIARNCIFRNHFASGFGAAIFNDGAFGGECNPVFENCRFENCTAELGGGAIYNNAVFGGECSPEFINCNFSDNDTPFASGGAVSNEGAEGGLSNPDFTNCQFFNNTAAVSGGAVYNFGKSGICSPTFLNNQFDNNIALAGGGVYNDGTFMGAANASFSACIFTNNRCTNGNGGAMYNNGIENGDSSPFLEDCTFRLNESSAAAGVIFNNGSNGNSSPTFFNCIFSENLANEIAAVMYNLGTNEGNANPSVNNCLFYRNTAYVSAAGIYNLGAQFGNASPVITNCTFFGNSAPISGAVYNNASNADGTANAIITNCIFWANNADLGKVLRNIWSQPTIDNCIVDVADCDELNSGDGGVLNCGNNLLFNQDPLFADTSINNFRLLMNSPAIDAGDNDAAAGIGVDLDGLPRLEGSLVDLGVYEFGSNTGTAPIITQNPMNQAVCEGNSVTFSVEATSSQPLSYQWQKDEIDIPGAMMTELTIENTTPDDSGNYRCVVTNDLGEMITSGEGLLTIDTLQEVSVEILASALEICEGESVTLTAIATNPGTIPTYQWMINGNNFGGSIASFSIDALEDGDEITLTLLSSADCINNPEAVSNTLTFSVESILEASIEIEGNDFSFCESELASFTAIPINGGDMPTYNWLINGIPTGDNTIDFASNFLNDGDQIQVEMTSSKSCIIDTTVLSDIIIVDILPIVTPEISITAPVDTAICVGTEVTFVATPINEGDMPSYQWQINGNSVGMDASLFTTNTLEDGDIVWVQMTSSAPCAEPNMVLSNELEIAVDSCNVATFEIFPDHLWSINPNPVVEECTLSIASNWEGGRVRIFNISGQLVFEKILGKSQNEVLSQPLNLSFLNGGTHIVKIENGNIFASKKLILIP